MTDSTHSGSSNGTVVMIPAEPVPTRQISVLWQLEEYWRSITLPGQIPFRHDVQPKAIGPCLSHVYLASIVAPGLARLRFAGQELANIFGMDPRGMPMSALYDLRGRQRLGPEEEVRAARQTAGRAARDATRRCPTRADRHIARSGAVAASPQARATRCTRPNADAQG